MISPSRPPSSGVAHFFSRMNLAGGELRTLDVVRATKKHFDFVALSGASGELDSVLLAENHSVIHMRMSLAGLPRIYQFLRSRGLRAVHCHLGIASGPILVLARLAGIGIRIAHFRSDGIGGQKSVRRSLALVVSRWFVNAFATHIVGVSPQALELGWKPGWAEDRRCRVIPNGVDAGALRVASAATRKGRPNVEERLVAINIGRVEPSKNRGRAIRVWEHVAASGPSTLLLVGELNSDDREVVNRVRSRIGPDSAIVEVGDVPDVASFLGQSHVTIVTSRREGLPGVILESLATGTPVVSTDLPGAKWIAESCPGITILSLGDDDPLWANAIKRASRSSSQELIDGFERGPFVLRRVVPDFEALWKTGHDDNSGAKAR